MSDTAGVVGQNPFKTKARFDSIQSWKYVDKLNRLIEFKFSVPNDDFHRSNALIERQTFVPFIKPFRGFIVSKSSNETTITLTAKEFAVHLERRIFRHDTEARVTYTKEDWFNTLWKHRRRIIIDLKDVEDDDLTTQEIRINVTDVGFKAHAKTDGFDFRVTKKDGTTLISHERIAWDSSTGALEL